MCSDGSQDLDGMVLGRDALELGGSPRLLSYVSRLFLLASLHPPSPPTHFPLHFPKCANPTSTTQHLNNRRPPRGQEHHLGGVPGEHAERWV